MPKKVTRRKKLPDYTSRGCPYTKNNSKWCFALCEVGPDGMGTCGRIAPHSLESNIQRAIKKHNLKKYGTEKCTTV